MQSLRNETPLAYHGGEVGRTSVYSDSSSRRPIFAGTKTVPAGGTTVFKSVGLAVEDVAAAKLVYNALAASQH